jgi:hypothetical protein
VTIKLWLDQALQDADRRGLPALRPLLETLARATSALRNADWNADAQGRINKSHVTNHKAHVATNNCS